MAQLRAGVDIGGTKVRIGIVDEAGNLLKLSEKLAVSGYQSGDALMAAIAKTIRHLMQAFPGDQLKGVGVGAPGPLNSSHEVVLDTPNTAIIQNYPLVSRLQAHFEAPVRMNNDANVFVLGEAIAGAGKGEAFVYGITLGTGYGHGFVWDGRILSGAHGTATEYGLAPYKGGTFEDVVSGPALERHYHSITGQRKSGIEIFDLARGGETSALEAWRLLGSAIGQSLIYVTFLLDPGVIVIGGSLAAGYDFFIRSLREEVDAHLFSNQQGKLRIVPASLGDAAPIIGAAALIP